MVHHDPGGTSHAPDAHSPKDGVRVRWKQPLEIDTGFPFCPPIVANGLVYGVGRELVCVTAESGAPLFRSEHNVGTPALAVARAYQSPTLAYSTSFGSGVIGLHPHGGLVVGGVRVGSTRWRTPREDTQMPTSPSGFVRRVVSPVASNGTVFINNIGHLLAIDASSGRIQWRSSPGKSRPAVRNGTVYVTGRTKSGGRSLFGYDTETGEQTFLFSSESRLLSVIAGPNYLVVGTEGDGLWAVDYDETRRWKHAPDELSVTEYPTAVAMADGVVYAGFDVNDRNWLLAIDGEKGTELWRTELPKGEIGPDTPTVANDTVYVPTNELTAVDATDGHVRWRFSLEGSSMAFSPATLVGETLFVLGITPARSHLYALGER